MCIQIYPRNLWVDSQGFCWDILDQYDVSEPAMETKMDEQNARNV